MTILLIGFLSIGLYEVVIWGISDYATNDNIFIITITKQAPNEPSYSQSGGVSITVANPQ